jgi:hypothetical protein
MKGREHGVLAKELGTAVPLAVASLLKLSMEPMDVGIVLLRSVSEYICQLPRIPMKTIKLAKCCATGFLVFNILKAWRPDRRPSRGVVARQVARTLLGAENDPMPRAKTCRPLDTRAVARYSLHRAPLERCRRDSPNVYLLLPAELPPAISPTVAR